MYGPAAGGAGPDGAADVGGKALRGRGPAGPGAGGAHRGGRPLDGCQRLHHHPTGPGAQGSGRRELGWFSGGEATADGLRTYVLFSYYTVELPNGGEPYAITVDLSGIGRMLKWAGFILLTVQIISLIANLFRNAGTIRRTLRPIQELAATAAGSTP